MRELCSFLCVCIVDCYLAPINKKAVCFMLGLRTVCVVVDSVLGGLDI